MSEAMSRHEIEDVLSSIRRLVSHEDRAEHAVAEPDAASPSKLVLTSALRVDGQPEAPLPEPSTQEEDGFKRDVTPSALPTDASQANAATPAFADAPVRAPLLTRIARASQPKAADIIKAGNAEADTPKTTSPAPELDAPAHLDEAVADNVLESTLARLEEALSITTTAPETAAPAATLDEEVLAQVVSKIVRQELQGELGERITRNIRKLVRAEVARELQMRNL